MAIIDCKKKFLAAAQLYANKLGIPDDIVVIIKTKKKLKGLLGYCEYIPQTDETPFNSFLIVIEDKGKRSTEDPLTVLAHEMVHVKQYVNGELENFAGYSLWKGQRIDDFDAGRDDYYFAPYEVEAYGLQVGLHQMYLRSMEQ